MQRVGGIGVIIAMVSSLLITVGLEAQDFLAAGGNGRSGGDGGEVEFRANRGIRAGGKAKVKTPKIPALQGATTLVAADLDVSGAIVVADLDASPGDLDPDDFEVTTAGNFAVLLGTTLELEADVVITSTSGGVFVLGAIQDNDGNDDGVDLTLRSIRKQVAVTGTIDVEGENAGDAGDAGDIDLIGLQVVAGGTATISARGGSTTGGGDGGAGGNLTIENFTPVGVRNLSAGGSR
jgi:hypothetical protein